MYYAAVDNVTGLPVIGKGLLADGTPETWMTREDAERSRQRRKANFRIVKVGSKPYHKAYNLYIEVLRSQRREKANVRTDRES